jgi:ribokinase
VARGRVAMVGAVGDDRFGIVARDALASEGIDVRHVTIAGRMATGVALIAVDPAGENQISVAPGANATVAAGVVEAALDDLVPTVVLASLEVPEDAVRAAAAWSHAHGARLVLNPAPSTEGAAALARMADVVTPNEIELAALGALPSSIAVVETRGAAGVRLHLEGVTEDVPSLAVVAVDTTGAGDCFNGVLAAGLLQALPLGDAARRAAAAAAASVTVTGARAGMPTRAELDRLLAGPGVSA